MRGLLRFTKSADPLRRGGLVFAAIGVPLVVAAKQLTGARLAQLIADPTVAIEVGQDEGDFTPAPEFVDVGVEQLQMMIDAAPEVDLPAEIAADPVAAALDVIYGKLHAAGFKTVDEALELIALRDVDNADKVDALQGDLSNAQARVVELEKEVAELTAAAKAAPKAKTGKPAE